ncbi:MBL fold metallo-hydrolase [Novosphingobium profundi]|uniref:MBL fold metallo-hydrolase n=1 Tax=Novosphingobium profundi TaxID=1774954 RepID=UPI001BDAA559|nr:MBL fold metallo-hydrolase [Novosphingobium profundi]MBT0669209.1 MBL fold metallo-hydrolase [Novosphingobium profundi]
MRARLALALLAFSLSLGSAPARADQEPAALGGAPAPMATHWITLGTMGGPIPSAERSQPANLLLRGPAAFLVDCGDGAVERLTGAHVRLEQVRGVVLSHLHFDHTAGLAAVLGLRFQTNVTQPLTIYGPPGTKALVAGLLAAMEPAVEAGYGLPGARTILPGDSVSVVELSDGATFRLGDIAVTARQNTHYSFQPGSAADARFKSLAFRFEAPGRTIVYTGDTGPSPAVEELAKGADLLVSEMIDVARTLANVQANTPNASADALTGIEEHLARHHLTPEQVGHLAQRAGVRALVVTHVVAPRASAGDRLGYLGRISRIYPGPTVIANDLDQF